LGSASEHDITPRLATAPDKVISATTPATATTRRRGCYRCCPRWARPPKRGRHNLRLHRQPHLAHRQPYQHHANLYVRRHLSSRRPSRGLRPKRPTRMTWWAIGLASLAWVRTPKAR